MEHIQPIPGDGGVGCDGRAWEPHAGVWIPPRKQRWQRAERWSARRCPVFARDHDNRHSLQN